MLKLQGFSGTVAQIREAVGQSMLMTGLRIEQLTDGTPHLRVEPLIDSGLEWINDTGETVGPHTIDVSRLRVKLGSGLGFDGNGAIQATGTAGVTSLGGATGAVTLGPALSMAGQVLTLDTDLSDIAALAGASGLLRKTAGVWGLDTATYLTANQSITLSGEASGTGATAITVTLANSAVIGKVLTGYVVGANTALAATDTILGAFQKVQGQLNAKSNTGHTHAISDITYTGLTTGTVLRATGATTAAFGALDLTITASTTGALRVDRGGTGLASYTTGNYLVATGATTLAQQTPTALMDAVGANRTLTLSGTAGEIEVTGGGQTLAANRTWTIGLPNDVDITTSLDVGTVTGITAATMRVGGDIRSSGTIYATDFVLVGGAGGGSGIALNDLSDVTVSGATTGQYLRKSAGDWVASDILTADLGSGTANTTTFLRGDRTWAVASLVGVLDDLTDVVITTPAVGHFLRHNGTNWVNTLLVSGDLPAHVHSGADITSGTVADARLSANVLLSTGSYANPTWITSLAATKLTGTVASARLSGVYSGVTGLGTQTQVLTGQARSAVAAITSLVASNSSFYANETNVGSYAGYAPAFGQVTVYTSGYRSHMILGSYRTASGWGGGPFLSWGGADANATEVWQFSSGGGITHSSGLTFLHSGNYGSYALPLSGGSLSGALAVSGASMPGNLNVAGNAYLGMTSDYSSGSVGSSLIITRTVSTGNGATHIYAVQNGGNSYADIGIPGGTLITAASTTSAASLRIPHGTAPTTPTNGDVWTTTVGLNARINGASVLYPTSTGTNATGTWGISISGNAATVTNGVYTTGSYADPAWITSLAATKLTGTVASARLSGVYSGVTGLGTQTQVLTGQARPAVAAITSLHAWNSSFYANETNVGGSAGYVPAFGQATVYTSGYRSHMILGSYRTASAWGGGPFISWGGADANATEVWQFSSGGGITHSSGLTFLHSGNYGSYALPLSGGSLSGALAVTGTVTATNWILSSDERLKRDVKPIESALAFVREHEGVHYWHDEHRRYELGFIAQSFRASRFRDELTTTDDRGFLGIFYDRAIPILWNAVREQDTEVAMLNRKVAALEAEVAMLKGARNA